MPDLRSAAAPDGSGQPVFQAIGCNLYQRLHRPAGPHLRVWALVYLVQSALIGAALLAVGGVAGSACGGRVLPGVWGRSIRHAGVPFSTAVQRAIGDGDGAAEAGFLAELFAQVPQGSLMDAPVCPRTSTWFGERALAQQAMRSPGGAEKSETGLAGIWPEGISALANTLVGKMTWRTLRVT